MDKRVLFLTPGLTKGGAETQLMKVAEFLRSQQKDIMILALNPLNDFNIDGINVRFLKSWKKNPVNNIITIYKTLKSFKPDVVVAFMFAAIILGRLLKLLFKFRLVSSIRTPVLDKKWYASFKATSLFDDEVVYNSHSSKAIFENNHLIKKKGIVINNAIKLPLGQTNFNQSVFDNADRPFIWCCVAHFRPEKDYRTLFKAIARNKDSRDFRIDILGHIVNQDWPYKMIKELNIEDKVRILGFKRNVNDYLNKADAFVLSTHWEGSPNSVLEAMAYSKPVVVSSVPGIEDILKGANCGFLFTKGSEIDLAEKMLRIMTMPAIERSILGSNGRKYVEMHYAEELVMERWLSIINSSSNPANLSV